jgi:hypothetical protein
LLGKPGQASALVRGFALSGLPNEVAGNLFAIVIGAPRLRQLQARNPARGKAQRQHDPISDGLFME